VKFKGVKTVWKGPDGDYVVWLCEVCGHGAHDGRICKRMYRDEDSGGWAECYCRHVHE
jgi:hypothetical protein